MISGQEIDYFTCKKKMAEKDAAESVPTYRDHMPATSLQLRLACKPAFSAATSLQEETDHSLD
jgi:hypothetical protein